MRTSSFYSNNEKKQRAYVKDRRIKEEQEEQQQQVVDEQIAKELGLESKASRIGELSARVAKKLNNAVVGDEDVLLNAITNGTLSTLFEKVKVLDKTKLNMKEQSILSNLENKANIQRLNEAIGEEVMNGPEAIQRVLLEELGGDSRNIYSILKKASKINLDDYTSARQARSRKGEERERAGMEMEDVNYALKPLAGKEATDAEKEKQAKAQADLDLIALFQQDVKEGRKRQALKDLERLNADEDLRLRINFQKVLEDIKKKEIMENIQSATEEKNRKALKEYKEQKMLIDKMMNLIENQRMHDAFMEFSNAEISNAFKEKIARNLQALRHNKKFIEGVKNMNKAERERASNEAIREFTRNMNKVTRKDSDSTSIMTEGEMKIDNRQFNRGSKKKNDTNAELEKFIDVLIQYHNAPYGKKTGFNDALRNMINRQKKVNPAIAERMKQMKSAFINK